MEIANNDRESHLNRQIPQCLIIQTFNRYIFGVLWLYQWLSLFDRRRNNPEAVVLFTLWWGSFSLLFIFPVFLLFKLSLNYLSLSLSIFRWIASVSQFGGLTAGRSWLLCLQFDWLREVCWSWVGPSLEKCKQTTPLFATEGPSSSTTLLLHEYHAPYQTIIQLY